MMDRVRGVVVAIAAWGVAGCFADRAVFEPPEAEACHRVEEGADGPGGWVQVAVADGTACDDGLACTTGDKCSSGTCEGEPVTCEPTGPCVLRGTCNPVDGVCSQPAKAAGTDCDDLDACTSDDRCDARGVCGGTDKDCDDAIACTLDSCDAGVCVHDDTPCRCAGAEDCDDLDPCTTDSCDTESGECVHVIATGRICDDGDPCTLGDGCSASGVCQGTEKDCDDFDRCTTDSCVEGACVNAIALGAGCSDGDDCTELDTCQADGSCAGTALDCDDGNGCTADSCDGGVCVNTVLVGADCDDGNACTVTDVCQSDKSCKGVKLTCNDTNACTADSCDDGDCVHTPLAGAPCHDGDPCTDDDECKVDGRCIGDAIVCNDGQSCTVDTCVGGACQFTGTCECDDNADCEDNNPCTADSCNFSVGECRNVAVGDGTFCNDGDPCTTESCQEGQCEITPVTCTQPDDPCLVSACTGGVCKEGPAPSGTSCEDGDDCTAGDRCDDRSCVPGGPASDIVCDVDDTPAGHANMCSSGACLPRIVALDYFAECLVRAGRLHCLDEAVIDWGVGRGVIDLSIGGGHACAVLDDRSVRCWGNGSAGRLGYGNQASVEFSSLPAAAGPVTVGGTAVQVVAGDFHSCAVLSNGDLRCWGNGSDGKLGYGDQSWIGDNELPDSKPPVELGGRAQQVDASFGHTCAVLEDKTIRCWGTGDGGVLGYGNQEHVGDDEHPSSAGPVDVDGHAALVALGYAHTCALLELGTVRCWGSNGQGQLGGAHKRSIGDDELPSSEPTVDLGGPAVQLSVGSYHSCVVWNGGSARYDGDIRCWGDGGSGQLGYGNLDTIGDDELPSAVGPVNLGGKAVHVATGWRKTCALLDDGVIKCWGHGFGSTPIVVSF